MTTETPDTACAVCGRLFARRQMTGWSTVRPGLSELIASEVPGWIEGAHICHDDLARYRMAYVTGLLERERGELGALDRQVVESLRAGQFVSQLPEDTADRPVTFGERMADRVADFGGSWAFIVSFTAVLVAWMAVNTAGLLARPFDPYPFILLNLVLSSLAAVQAPVIMMSQKRQETKDRQRAENDYRVNLKAELEVRLLHEKLDHQIAHQWEKLVELQQIQIELLEERNGRD